MSNLYSVNCFRVDYFKGLLSEKKIQGKWVAPQKGHTHNEPLDCRIYAMACASYYLSKYYVTGLDKEGAMARKKKVEEEKIEQVKKDDSKDISTVDDNPVIDDSHKSVKVPEPPKKVFPHW